jgi:pSer/pThr/pTyr-binding forkhead associated (FHA) protein
MPPSARSTTAALSSTTFDSANGTFVNDVRVGSQPLRLEAGDVIRVGQSALRVERLTSATERKRLPTVSGAGMRLSSHLSAA